MAERILVPLDGSRTSEKALDYVKGLFAEIKPDKGNEVVLFEVVKPPLHHIFVEGGTMDVEFTDEEIKPMMTNAMNYLESKAEMLRESGIKVTCEVIKGINGVSTAESIVEAEKELNGNLLAMSTHGRRGFSRWLYGSVAEHVVRTGSLPVMTVRA